MARPVLSFLPIILSLLYIFGTAKSTAAAAATTASSSFIKSSCSATQYPAVCVESLSVYATAIRGSPRQLAQTALSVSLDRAQSTKTFVTQLSKLTSLKRREYAAIRDCLEEVGDSVDRISKSISELKSVKATRGPEFIWHMSNVDTWVSAALTDENTCIDGFGGKAMDGKIKASVKARVTNLVQVTSNALALVNKFGGKL